MARESKVIYHNEAKESLLKYLERLQDEQYIGIATGLENLDEFLIPLTPSDMMVILARPSHGKSSLLIYYAMLAAKLAVESRTSNIKFSPPIYITAETPIEELGIKTLSNYSQVDSRVIRTGKKLNDWEKLANDAEEMAKNYPITYVGHSVINPRRGLITIDYIEECVYEAVDRYKCPPRAILVDYLQRIASPGFSDRRLGLAEVVERLKDLHMSVGCPLIFGSQAKREVDEKPFPVPDVGDGKETGSIEETADVVISTMRPIKYWKEGQVIPRTDPELFCTPNLFFINVLKQRNGDSNQGFWVTLDPKVTQFSEMERLDIV